MANPPTMDVRFADEERDLISRYAAPRGKAASEVVCESALEAVEDAIDVYEYNLALAEDDGGLATMDEVMREVLENQ